MTTSKETLQRLLNFNGSDIEIATDLGRDALLTAISRLEDAVHILKRRLADFDNAEADAYGRANYLSWAANDIRNMDFNDLRLSIAEKAGELKSFATARVHIQHICEK